MIPGLPVSQTLDVPKNTVPALPEYNNYIYYNGLSKVNGIYLYHTCITGLYIECDYDMGKAGRTPVDYGYLYFPYVPQGLTLSR
jgi:hypothetical protein